MCFDGQRVAKSSDDESDLVGDLTCKVPLKIEIEKITSFVIAFNDFPFKADSI